MRRDDVMAVMLDAMLTGDVPGAIERQELAGQESMVVSCVLPVKGSDNPAFAVMGIVFGERVDELFAKVELPAGWVVKPTANSYWSELVDNAGRTRAGIFYKAAFYDRCAYIYPRRRFEVVFDHERWLVNRTETRVFVVDNSNGREAIFELTDCGPWLPEAGVTMSGVAILDAEMILERKCEAWLDEHWPMWRDVCAYW